MEAPDLLKRTAKVVWYQAMKPGTVKGVWGECLKKRRQGRRGNDVLLEEVLPVASFASFNHEMIAGRKFGKKTLGEAEVVMSKLIEDLKAERAAESQDS